MEGIHEPEGAAEAAEQLGLTVEQAERLAARPSIARAESDGALRARMGTDAAAWAREMSPGDWLHGWLRNAIEAGRAAGYSQGRRDASAAADRMLAARGFARLAPGLAQSVREALAWPLPEDSAGRPPEDPAGRTQPENLAGRKSDIARAADALEQIACHFAAQTSARRRAGR